MNGFMEDTFTFTAAKTRTFCIDKIIFFNISVECRIILYFFIMNIFNKVYKNIKD